MCWLNDSDGDDVSGTNSTLVTTEMLFAPCCRNKILTRTSDTLNHHLCTAHSYISNGSGVIMLTDRQTDKHTNGHY